MPDYQNKGINTPTIYTDARLGDRVIPFHQVDPALIIPDFKAGKAKNLGALIFLNVLTSTPFESSTLCLAQSRTTKELYFTQRLSPSWLTLFEKDRPPFSFNKENVGIKLLRIMTPFFCKEHLDWWENSTLLCATGQLKQFQVDYDRILSDEIVVTMLRLYLTPISLIHLLFDHVFKKPPNEDLSITLAKEHIIETILRFKCEFQTDILPLIQKDISHDRFYSLYLCYLQDIYQFTIFPVGHFSRSELTLMTCESLVKAIDTELSPDSALYDAFNRCLELSETSCAEILTDEKHFLWETLNQLSRYLLQQDVSTYQIEFDEHTLCLLIKSIEFGYTPLATMLLTCAVQDTRLTITQQPLAESICVKINHLEWRGYSLVDIAYAAKNDDFAIYLISKGATPLISADEELLPPSIEIERGRARSRSTTFIDLSMILPHPIIVEEKEEKQQDPRRARRNSFSL